MIPIPSYLKKEIRDYILSICPIAQQGWEFANQDEDTLTGDFLGKMRTGWNKSDNHIWRISYNKPRSRGDGAMEKKIGVDGIITIHFKDTSSKTEYYKSVTFQAKKEGNRIDDGQWDKMKTFFPGGNLIINYSANGYWGITPDGQRMAICSLIAYNFLNCYIGIEGLRYNHASNKFIRPTGIPLTGSVSHELMIDVFEE